MFSIARFIWSQTLYQSDPNLVQFMGWGGGGWVIDGKTFFSSIYYIVLSRQRHIENVQSIVCVCVFSKILCNFNGIKYTQLATVTLIEIRKRDQRNIKNAYTVSSSEDKERFGFKQWNVVHVLWDLPRDLLVLFQHKDCPLEKKNRGYDLYTKYTFFQIRRALKQKVSVFQYLPIQRSS